MQRILFKKFRSRYRIKCRQNLAFEAFRSEYPVAHHGVDDRGATIPEYAIIVGVFVSVALAMAVAFKPLQERFHNDVTPGLDLSYPANFINQPPTPTPALVP